MDERQSKCIPPALYDFQNPTDIFVNPLFLSFCSQRAHCDTELALKTGILVPKVGYDPSEFKISPWDHIAIIDTWSIEHMCITRFAQKCQ